MDGQRLDATHVVTILRHLHICPDATEAEAQQWLDDMDEQITEFLEHRRVEEEEEPQSEDETGETPLQVRPLKFFESVASFFGGRFVVRRHLISGTLNPRRLQLSPQSLDKRTLMITYACCLKNITAKMMQLFVTLSTLSSMQP
jgi:hypothetical protein